MIKIALLHNIVLDDNVEIIHNLIDTVSNYNIELALVKQKDIEAAKKTILAADITIVDATYRNAFEFEIFNFIEKNARYVFVDSSYSFCAYNTYTCFTDSSIKNCCNKDKFHLYRNLYVHAALNVFSSELTKKSYEKLYGSTTSKVIIDTLIDKNKLDAYFKENFWKNIKERLNTTPKETSFKEVFVYKSYGGLGDYFIALPAMYKLQKVSKKVTIGVPKNVLGTFKRNTKGFQIIAADNIENIDFSKYDKVINLGNYPKRIRDSEVEGMIDFPTQNKLKQHSSRHYTDAIAALHPKIDNKHKRYPYFKNKIDKKNRYFTIHPGAGFEPKWWKTENYIALITQLLKKLPQYTCKIILGPSDPKPTNFEKIKRVEFELGNLDAVEKCVSGASFHIGNDSGITHFAGAFNIPSVAIHGLTGPGAWATMAEQTEVIWGKPGNCDILCRYDTAMSCKHRSCLNSISVKKVLESAYKLIQRNLTMDEKIKYVFNPEVIITKEKQSFILKKSTNEMLIEFKNESEFSEFNTLINDDLIEDNVKNESLIPLIEALIAQEIIFKIPIL